MNFPYGSKVEMDGIEWTFTKIENTKSGGVFVFSLIKMGKQLS